MENLKPKKRDDICDDDIITTWIRGYKQKMTKREVDKLVQRRRLENRLERILSKQAITSSPAKSPAKSPATSPTTKPTKPPKPPTS